MGQERPVTVVRLVAKGTVEDKDRRAQGDQARAGRRHRRRGRRRALRGLSEQDVRALLGASDGEAADDAEPQRAAAAAPPGRRSRPASHLGAAVAIVARAGAMQV
jgi:hypothetical protein